MLLVRPAQSGFSAASLDGVGVPAAVLDGLVAPVDEEGRHQADDRGHDGGGAVQRTSCVGPAERGGRVGDLAHEAGQGMRRLDKEDDGSDDQQDGEHHQDDGDDRFAGRLTGRASRTHKFLLERCAAPGTAAVAASDRVGSFDGTGAGHDPPAAAPAPLIRDDCRTLLRKGMLGCAVVNAPWQIYRLSFLRVRKKSRTTNSPSRSGCALSTRPPFRRATSFTKAVKRSSSTSMKMFNGAFRRVILSTSARVSSSVSGAGGQSKKYPPSRRRWAVGSPSVTMSTIGSCSGRWSR